MLLPQHPLEAFAVGAASEVTVLTGSNRDEARLFLVAPGVIDYIDEPTLTAGAAAYGLPPQGLDRYRRNRPGASPGDLLAAVVSDWFFMVPAVRHAEARTAGGGTTFVYRFEHPDPADNHNFGAAHAVEIPFVFDTIDLDQMKPLIGDSPSRAVADTAHQTWVAFVTTGNPGWAPYSTPTRTTGIIAEKLEAVDDPRGEELAVWSGIR